ALTILRSRRGITLGIAGAPQDHEDDYAEDAAADAAHERRHGLERALQRRHRGRSRRGFGETRLLWFGRLVRRTRRLRAFLELLGVTRAFEVVTHLPREPTSEDRDDDHEDAERPHDRRAAHAEQIGPDVVAAG